MNSVFLATVIGWYMFILGGLILIKQEQMKDVFSDILSHRGLFFLLSLMAFVFGLLIVLSHNHWVNDWQVSITIFGWILLVGSLIRLFFLDAIVNMSHSIVKHPIAMQINAAVFLIFGIYLLYHVYHY